MRDIALNKKKVLIRVDFNVPMENGIIVDDARIRASLPTIQYAIEKGAALLLMSHLGRPGGKRDPELSLAPCAKRLSDLLGLTVKMAPDCCGGAVEELVQNLQPKEILMLENLRFHKGEESPEQEPSFASELASLGDVYINDAFATSHRRHASVALVPKFFPKQAVMGLLLEKEIAHLSEIFFSPTRPFCALLGGAKLSTKFKVIKTLMQKADVLLIGGAMAFTFLKAEGVAIGRSLIEEAFIPTAHELLDVSSQSRCRLLLPQDFVATRSLQETKESRIFDLHEGIPNDFFGVDIGPKTIHLYEKEMKKSATIFWNGPVGVCEVPPFDKGTSSLAGTMARLTPSTKAIAGGGDTIAAIDRLAIGTSFTHLSTGGGAALEFIEFGHLPGIDALSAGTFSHPTINT